MARDESSASLASARQSDDGKLLTEIIEGLSRPQKALSPKLFYDERGSRLFEQICELPEYYIPRTELALLRDHARQLAVFCGPRCVVVEPGAGSGDKTELLLDALEDPAAYVPVEISGSALDGCVRRLRQRFPQLALYPVCADFTQPFGLPAIDAAPWLRRLLFVPGSTLGNFEPEVAARLLAGWRKLLGPRGALVVGIDLRKPRSILEPAYDDAAGVTAAFNLNLLTRLNREFGANFVLDGFEHRALFNEVLGRIEMHLVSLRPQRVQLGNRSFLFAAGETLHTENSYKYRPGDFAELALAAGWARRELWIDAQDLFSVQCFDAIG